MKMRLDGLWPRLFLVQLATVVAVFVTLLLTVAQGQREASIRLVSPYWAQAVHASAPIAMRDNSGGRAISAIGARIGPPPADARRTVSLRFDALRRELARFGIAVEEVSISGHGASTITWLRVRDGGGARWIGFDGGVFGPDRTLRRVPFLLATLALVIAASGWLTWTMVSPLRRLRRGIEAYSRDDSRLPDVDAVGGPGEVRALTAAFVGMARERNVADDDRALMLAGISHDLRSPLARIKLAAELMPTSQPSVAEARASISRNVRIADHHLAAFLDFAMPVPMDAPQSVSVAALLEGAVRGVVADPSGVRIEVATGVSSVQVNRRMLERVLALGLDNAFKHGRTPIELRAYVRNADIVFEIEDSGPGLPIDDRTRLIRPFERGERARTTPGSGLGLALASRIAARIQGRVELDQRGRGLVFRCIIASRTDSVTE